MIGVEWLYDFVIVLQFIHIAMQPCRPIFAEGSELMNEIMKLEGEYKGLVLFHTCMHTFFLFQVIQYRYTGPFNGISVK